MNNPLLRPLALRSLMKMGNTKHTAHSSHTWPTYGSHGSVKQPPLPSTSPPQHSSPPPPCMHTITTLLTPNQPRHTNLTFHLHIQSTLRSRRLRNPPHNVKIFLKCQLISAALECLHRLNMFVSRLVVWALAELLERGGIINQEVRRPLYV